MNLGQPNLNLQASLFPNAPGGFPTSISTVGTTAVQLANARADRTRLLVQNNSASTLTISGSSNVTDGVGFILAPGAYIAFPIGNQVDVYCIAPSADNKVCCVEL